MMEEKDSNIIPYDDNSVKLKDDMNSLITEIVEETDVNKLKDLTSLFNVHQVKKDLLRSIQLNDVLDNVTYQMVQRFTKHPECFTNKELIDYLKVAQDAIDKASKGNTVISSTPAIQYNQQNNVNISIAESVDREGRERISDVISKILGQISSEQSLDTEEEPVLNNVKTKTEDTINED